MAPLRGLAPVLVALTGLLLGGCSSSGSPHATPPATGSLPLSSDAATSASAPASDAVPDPCSLLTPQQVQTITGEDAGTPSSSSLGAIYSTERTCSWNPVITFVGLASDFADLKATIEHDFGPTQPVPGVGEEAFWDPEGKALAARGGQFFVMAELSRSGSSDTDEAQIATCKDILAAMLSNL